MADLYIDKKNASLDVENQVLLVKDVSGQLLHKVPLKFLSRVVARGCVFLSSDVLCDLAESGVAFVAMSGRAGLKHAHLNGTLHNDALIRIHQVLAISKPEFAVSAARNIVDHKITRQLELLQQLMRDRPDQRKPLFDAIAAMESLIQTLQAQDPAGPSASLDGLRGLEGAAAAAYFPAYFSCFAPALQSVKRTKRPPLDPVNAVLSLSYTLLYAEAVAACHAVGLDPAVGFLHAPSFGRASMACDLMEPFRPMLDRWIWTLFQSETVRKEHFGTDGAGACLMGKAGRSIFYKAWSLRFRHLDRAMVRYARQYAKLFRHGSFNLGLEGTYGQ